MLHVTLLMFDFSNDDERYEAALELMEAMEESIRKEVGSDPLELTLEGIDTFQR